MKNKDIITRLQYELDRNTEWIKVADQKISIYLAFLGLIITLLSPKITVWINLHNCPVDSWKIFLISCGLLIFLIGTLYCVVALISKLKGGRKVQGLVYFGDVQKFEYHDYNQKIHSQTTDEYINDLAEQVYTTATIAYRKHVQFSNSVSITLTGLFIVLLIISIY